MDWGERFVSTEVEHAAKGNSDHCPLIVKFTDHVEQRMISYFKFQNMWTEHSSFLQLVESNWTGNYASNPIEIFFLK